MHVFKCFTIQLRQVRIHTSFHRFRESDFSNEITKMVWTSGLRRFARLHLRRMELADILPE